MSTKRSIKTLLLFIMTSLATLGWADSTISLQTIFQSTKKHFPVIKAAEQNVAMAYGKLQSAKGAFDPSINSLFNSTPSGGYENIYDQYEFNVPLVYANSNLFLTYRIGRGDWPSYYQNYLTNTGGDVILGVDFSLLRDYYIDPNRAKFQSAKINVALQKDEANNTRVSTLQRAGMAYWNWVAAAQKLQFVKQLLDLAVVRQKALTKRYHLGDSAKIDIVENKRLILQRQAALVYANLNYKRSSILLSLYYRNKKGKPIVPKITQVPKTLPKLLNEKTLASIRNRRALKLIYRNNPKLNALNKKISIEHVKLKLAKNNLLPNLDATVSTDKEFGKNGDPLLRQTAFNVGLKFSLDFPRNIAKGQFSKTRSKLRQLHYQEAFITQSLFVKFRNTLNELENDRKQVRILRNEVVLAKKIEDAEKVKFDQGDSSLFLVNQREQSTFSTRIEELDATIAYYLSKLKLQALCAFQPNCFRTLTMFTSHN